MVGTQTAAGNNMAAIEVQNALPTINMSVSEFYAGKTIFITGGTGFMGKVLLEKLLRSCPGVNKIYLLIRPKKGQMAHDRLQQLLTSPLFDQLRKERPGDLGKVGVIEGDITQPALAISQSDRAMLARTVNVVFHSAATVKFDEKLKLSVTINMLGVQRLVELCKKMAHLEALIHVSTAYCNCDRYEVKEIIYPPPINPDQVTSLVECLDEKFMDYLTPQLIGDRPNTYTFTKALAENWLKDNKGDLPLVIVRPSIVLSSIDGPIKGWVDNWNGPNGVLSAAAKGIFRTMLCDPRKTADIIPVDMVINLMIVAGWRMGTCKSQDLPIYNCVTGQQSPIKWDRFIDLCFTYIRKHPISDMTWYPSGSITSSWIYNTTNQYLLQIVPAYICDFVCSLIGKKPIMVNVQSKIVRAASCLEYFALREWQFDDSNVRKLLLTVSDSDKKEFYFDSAQVKWEEYIENYILGLRRFIFKEDAATIPKARKSITKLFWLHTIVQITFVLSLWHFLTLRYSPLRQLWNNSLRFLLQIARMLPTL